MDAIVPIDFDERSYLEDNEDAAVAVARGEWACGRDHYLAVGRAQGRRALPEVDERWYAKTYPVAAADLNAGKARNYVEHWLRLGRQRGYLPHAKARRPQNAAGFHSRFGGFWTDQANAKDILAGRLELGTISEAQAGLLSKWITDGFVIIEQAFDEQMLERATRDLDKAYEGQISKLKFDVHGIGRRIDWIPEAKTSPAKALDVHWFSPAIRELILAPKVVEFLHLLFERRALASQTLGFLRGSGQAAHQDTAYVNYSLPMQFVASWAALEDVVEGAGELFYYVGSHQIREFIYGGEFKGLNDAKRLGADRDIDDEAKKHIEDIRRQAEGMRMPKQRLMAKRGDVLLWHADLAHGGSPISTEHTRKSIVTHYCPAEVVPLYVERQPRAALKSHYGRAFYSTCYYSDIEPV